MKCLYIGQGEVGSTSRMRFEVLKSILNCNVDFINISPLIWETPKMIRSLGWRFKIGPMVNSINAAVLSFLDTDTNMFDLIWIDKGVFIYCDTLKRLRNRTLKLVHFTPDPAFTYHYSRLFSRSIDIYDFCVTTKSFEAKYYQENGCNNLLFCHQGYDPRVHFPTVSFDDKEFDVCFIGHFEKNRAEIVQTILDNNISVVLAGINWGKFVKKNRLVNHLFYQGENVVGADYSELISKSRIGLGFLSKWIPEQHTTRTFEIPACGALLATECTVEIQNVFSDNEVLYFNDTDDLLKKIKDYLGDLMKLKDTISRQTAKIGKGNYSYQEQLKEILKKIDLC